MLITTDEGEDRVRRVLSEGRTRERILRTVRKVFRDQECEDAAHDAVVQALAASGGFRAEAQLDTWLHRIAFNAALMRWRSRSRAARRVERARLDGGWSDGEAGAAARLELEEDRRRLRAAVGRLPDPYREVIERCVYGEQAPRRVAGDLGISASAVRTRFCRAQDRLRKLLAA